MKKRIFVLLLVCILSFTGCANNKESSETSKNDVKENEIVQNSTNQETGNENDSNETVVDTTTPESAVKEDFSNEHIVFTDETLNHYEIHVVLDTEKDQIVGTQKITYTNRENVDLKEIYLHLYPNAFKEGNHPSLFDTDLNEIDQQYGYVDVTALSVNGELIDASLEPIDTTLKIPYNFVSGETFTIEMSYTIGISTTSERYGVANDIYNLGNWYPILAVYDEDGWNLDPYYDIGDPFYSDVSNYDVYITLPESYEVASSGSVKSLKSENGLSTYGIQADRMRDFAFVIGKDFLVDSTDVSGIKVNLYYPDSVKGHKWLDEALTYGAESIRIFSEYIGPYPYDEYDVVLTNFPSGMEYPGLVMISTRYLDGFKNDNLRNVIVHETGHQWFYSIVGDDEIEEGWIDEGLTSYITAFYDLKMEGKSTYDKTMRNYQNIVDDQGLENIDILKSAKYFNNWTEYGLAAYTTPALMYHHLYVDYGEDKMVEFLQTLYKNYKFDILKEETLKEAVVEVYGEEIQTFINTWLK